MDEARQLMSTYHPSHGLEEMRHLLMCATLELDSARAVASAEVELHDAQVRHLQELLAAAQRERDEAREQYLGLQGCLSRSPSTNAGRGTAGSTTLGRRSRDHQSQQQQQQLPNSGLSGVMSPAASTVQQEVVQQQQQQFDMEQLQKHLEILQDDEQHLEIFQDEHLVDHLEDLADLDSMLQQIPQEQTDHTNALQNRSTHEQYFHHEPCAVDDSGSDELLSHCIRQEQQMQVQLQSADQQVMSSSLMEQQQIQHQQGDMSVQLQQSPWRQSLSSGPSPAAGFSPAAAAVLCSSAVVSPQLLPSCLPAPPAALFQTAAGSPVSSLLATGSTGLAVSMQQQQQQRSGAPASVQQLLPCKHVLPEPPEADLQVMLSSLPEKGKLMQAVMDAGPLLQTLLMASSSPQLPQWRHPPPGLESLQLPITNSSCATDPNMSTTTLQGGNKYGVHRQLQRLSSFSSSYPISNNSISNNNSSSSSSMSSPSAAAAAVSGFMSSNVNRHLRRVNSMGHLMSPEMALTNQPRKYTKIY
ncbi:unnamed protein product [Sphagnum jensenii]|uniref:Uncharacterized protein n=1 Tax=Sphagnum jensenii TaxID=128206 RepID=A0ABP0XC38_9BRYO